MDRYLWDKNFQILICLFVRKIRHQKKKMFFLYSYFHIFYKQVSRLSVQLPQTDQIFPCNHYKYNYILAFSNLLFFKIKYYYIILIFYFQIFNSYYHSHAILISFSENYIPILFIDLSGQLQIMICFNSTLRIHLMPIFRYRHIFI